jgi:hypothetical protein
MQHSAQIGRGLTSGVPCRARTLRCTTTAALLPPRPAVAFIRPGSAALPLPRQAAPTSSPVVCNSAATFAAAGALPQSDGGSPASRGKRLSFSRLNILSFLVF